MLSLATQCDTTTRRMARSAMISDPVYAAIVAYHELVTVDLPIEVIEECDQLLIDLVLNIKSESKRKCAAMGLSRKFAEAVFGAKAARQGGHKLKKAHGR